MFSVIMHVVVDMKAIAIVYYSKHVTIVSCQPL